MEREEKEEKTMSNKEKVKNNTVADHGIFRLNFFLLCRSRSPPYLMSTLPRLDGIRSSYTIQAEAIPSVISGRHVNQLFFCRILSFFSHKSCNTGSCPSLDLSDKLIIALVLVPTRELCLQVYEILLKLLHRFHWIVPGYITGGENKSKEKARLRKGISILIATPGRLLDHLKNTRSFLYMNLRWIVFDEADRMLELGFEDPIKEILELLGLRQNDVVCKEDIRVGRTKISKQNLLLSATLNEKVNHLANISLDNPVMIGLDDKKITSELPSQPGRHFEPSGFDRVEDTEHLESLSSNSIENYNLSAQLLQSYVKASCGSRLAVLLSILRTSFEGEVSQKIVVFLSTRAAVEFHYALLSEFRWSPNSESGTNQKQAFVRCRVFRLHGKMKHDDRKTAFQGFRSERSALLLCTDVAARGLDFPKVRCIIQYDPPGEASEYVHRVGRTARIGEKGEALLFLQPAEIDYLHNLQQHGVSLKEFPLRKVLDSFPLHGQKHFNKSFISLEMHPWLLSLQKAVEDFISAEFKMKNLAKDAYCCWVRAYAAHRGSLKRIFLVKKLHLGLVARNFGLKDQPSLVGRSLMLRAKKRGMDQRQGRSSKRRRLSIKGE